MRIPIPDKEARYTLELKVHSLKRIIRYQEKTIAKLRKEKLSLVRETYLFPKELYEIGWVTRSRDAVFGKVLEKLSEFGDDPEGWKRLASFLDRYLENSVSDLASISTLTEDDIRLFCYFVIGLDTASISELMGIKSLNTVYSKRKRLIDKVARMGPKRAQRFLDLLE